LQVPVFASPSRGSKSIVVLFRTWYDHAARRNHRHLFKLAKKVITEVQLFIPYMPFPKKHCANARCFERSRWLRDLFKPSVGTPIRPYDLCAFTLGGGNSTIYYLSIHRTVEARQHLFLLCVMSLSDPTIINDEDDNDNATMASFVVDFVSSSHICTHCENRGEGTHDD